MKLYLKKKRSVRNRKKLKASNTGRYRISVYKSLKNISASQIIQYIKKEKLLDGID